jgi:Putative Flp pilus-assembly TadE/G-like
MRMISMLRARALLFFKDTGANLTIILALSAIPLVLAMGAGVDYARGLVVHSNMADALDAAGLAVGSQSSKPDNCSSASTATSASQTACASLQAVAQQFFNANFRRDASSTGVTPTVVINVASGAVTLTVSDSVPTTFLAAADRLMNSSALDNMQISASSTVVWGQTKLWVSLVLDNTGSMCEPDGNPCSTDTSSSIKINALKTASHNLLTTLQNASTTPGDVLVGIVPFAKDVNVGTANVNASWIDWTDWNTQAPTSAVPVPGVLVGPGDDCPWSSYNCLTQPGGVLTTTGSGTNVAIVETDTIPGTGTYSGYICPGSVPSSSSGQAGHYYNGCYTSVVSGTQNVSSCKNYNNCSYNSKTGKYTATTYTHPWVVNAKSTWRGCVMDRNQNDDADDTTPGTLFPAENDDSCPYASILTFPATVPASTSDMTTMFTNAGTKIDSMLAGGGTNQTIGLAHGMQLQVTGLPYSAPTVGADTTRYIILLSDGLNTMDRWYGNGSSQSTSVDTRMTAACNQAKTQQFVIYTIFVDLGGSSGNSSILSGCATDAAHYYHLTTSGAIITAFADIAQQITNLRVSN